MGLFSARPRGVLLVGLSGAASCLDSGPPSSCVRVSVSLKASLWRKLVNKLCGKASVCLQVVVKLFSFLSTKK